MLRTPLHESHRALGARLVDFAGWEMPIQFEGILAEHRAVRSSAGVFDVSHMGQLFVSGPKAAAFLAWVTTWDIRNLEPARCRYCHILDDKGHIIDDTIVYCLAPDEFLLVPNAATTDRIADWLASQISDFDASLEDCSAELACIALQGPDAPQLLEMHLALAVEPFSLARQGNLIVSGTGYTGEPGCEIILPVDAALPVWEALLALGATPCGLGARDTLRLERGMLLSGTDFDGSQTPLEANCGWVIGWGHQFIGREPLLAQRGSGYAVLRGIQLAERGVPRPGCDIFHNGERVGCLTSGTLSPSLGTGIGLAYLNLEPGTAVTVAVRGKHLNARVVRPPFQ